MTKIILEGSPISTQHLYAQKGRIRYMVKKAKELKESYVSQIRRQYYGEPMEGDLIVEIDLYRDDNRIRDRDNWHKLSMDAMQGIVYIDDSQIQQAIVTKHKGPTRMEFIVYEL